MVTKLFVTKHQIFERDKEDKQKGLRRTVKCGENLFVQYDEVAAENLMVQVIRVL